MADLKISVEIDGKGIKPGADETKRQIKSIGDEAVSTAKRTQSLAKVDFSGAIRQLKEYGDKIKNVGSAISGFGQKLTLGVSAPIAGLNILGLKFNALEEDSKTTFKVFLKDGEKAAQLFRELSDFADKTPFQLEEVLTGGTTLLQAKIEDLKGVLKDAGDLAAANKTKGATLADTTNVFSRLKAGDFGEGFERLRDFGISRQMLEGEGLKFDKQGSYKGSVEDAMKAVRTIIQRDMGGLMDEQSQNFSGQISTLMDTANRFLGELTKPLFDNLKRGLNEALPYLVQLKDAFKNLSPETKTTILVILGFIAALGPLAVIIGTIITVVGSLITAISTIAGAIGSVSLAPILAGIVAFIAVLAAVGIAVYALYQVWTKNIGGIQEKAAEVFNNLKTIIEPAVEEVSTFIQQSFAEVIAWVNTNLPTLVEAALNVINYLQASWAQHGEEIKSIVSSAWNIVKTIITGIGAQIGNIILLVANIINGNWSGAWENFKAIVKTGVNASISILGSLINIVWQILKAIVNRIISIGADFLQAAYQIGKNLLQGLLNGISEGASAVYEKVTNIISNIISIWESIPKIQSPSKVTTEIGEFLSEGLAVGMENKATQVKSTAKKIADDTIKILKDALKEFQKVAGMSPEQIDRTTQSDALQQGVSDLKEIIKLRKELGVDQYQALPDNPGAAAAVLQDLRHRKEAADDYVKSLDDIADAVSKTKELFEADTKAYEKALGDKENAIRQAGEANLLTLQKEIQSVGVTDELEKIRIQNAIDLKKLRLDLANDGLEEDDINHLVRITELEQGRLLELQKILQVSKEISDASDLNKSLNDQLTSLQNGGRELSEYEKTLRKLNENFKNISPAQREQILNTAAQIDAQKQFNDEYQKTYDFIRGALDVLTDKGKSFGDKMKAIFGGVLNSFKKMLMDIAAESITSKIMGGGSNGSSSQGFSLKNIVQRVLGGGNTTSGGNGSTPPFVSNSYSFAGSNNSTVSTNDILNSKTAEESLNFGNNTSSYTKLKQILGKGGIFGQDGFGFNSGTVQGIGGLAGFAGDVIGGSAGTILSGVSTGIGTASSLASILGISALGGPIGLAIGGIIGGVIGLGKVLFGRNKQRKADEKTRDALMVDTLKQLNEIKAEMESSKPGNIQSLLDNTHEIQKNYFDQANLLKDKKTRNIAIKDGHDRVDPLVRAIESASEAAKLKEQMRAVADERDQRLLPQFATGVYMDSAFAKQYNDFKRRNGLLPGSFTGKDTLPSMLAPGEMVLNPMQLERIRMAAGYDIFKNKGIPNYAEGTYVAPSLVPSASPSNSSVTNDSKRPIYLQLTLNQKNSGMVESDVEDLMFEVLDDSEFQVELIKTIKKIEPRERK